MSNIVSPENPFPLYRNPDLSSMASPELRQQLEQERTRFLAETLEAYDECVRSGIRDRAWEFLSVPLHCLELTQNQLLSVERALMMRPAGEAAAQPLEPLREVAVNVQETKKNRVARYAAALWGKFFGNEVYLGD